MMKRIGLYLMMVAIFVSAAFISCNKEQSMDATGEESAVSSSITMTMQRSGNVIIDIAGTDSITIDWGDGTALETRRLASKEGPLHIYINGIMDMIQLMQYEYVHSYTEASAHTITITGGNITHLNSYANQMTALDVSDCTALTWLDCHDNQLTSLNVSRNRALTGLNCRSNQLTSIDVKSNTLLTGLDCGFNQLTSIDVKTNTLLIELVCGNNQLASLDVNKNTAIWLLDCSNNQLTSLDVNKNTAIWLLFCSNNQLTSLDMSTNTALSDLQCDSNSLTSSALNFLFETLHNNDEYKTWICIGNNPGTDDCDRSIAEEKGWNVRDIW